MVWLPHTYLRPGVVRRSLDPQLRRLDVSRLWAALATLVDVRHGLRRLDLVQQTVEKLRDTTTPHRPSDMRGSEGTLGWTHPRRLTGSARRPKGRRPEGQKARHEQQSRGESSAPCPQQQQQSRSSRVFCALCGHGWACVWAAHLPGLAQLIVAHKVSVLPLHAVVDQLLVRLHHVRVREPPCIPSTTQSEGKPQGTDVGWENR